MDGKEAEVSKNPGLVAQASYRRTRRCDSPVDTFGGL